MPLDSSLVFLLDPVHQPLPIIDLKAGLELDPQKQRMFSLVSNVGSSQIIIQPQEIVPDSDLSHILLLVFSLYKVLFQKGWLEQISEVLLFLGLDYIVISGTLSTVHEDWWTDYTVQYFGNGVDIILLIQNIKHQ